VVRRDNTEGLVRSPRDAMAGGTFTAARERSARRTSVPFAFLYEYLPAEHQVRLASVSADTDDDLHPTAIDWDG
jgi:hypothetical protein